MSNISSQQHSDEIAPAAVVAPLPVHSPFHLKLADAPKSFNLYYGVNTIGRCMPDLVDPTFVSIDNENVALSRLHATIIVAPNNDAWLRDLGSTNGTQLAINSGEGITLDPQVCYQLSHGATITLGDLPVFFISDANKVAAAGRHFPAAAEGAAATTTTTSATAIRKSTAARRSESPLEPNSSSAGGAFAINSRGQQLSAPTLTHHKAAAHQRFSHRPYLDDDSETSLPPPPPSKKAQPLSFMDDDDEDIPLALLAKVSVASPPKSNANANKTNNQIKRKRSEIDPSVASKDAVSPPHQQQLAVDESSADMSTTVKKATKRGRKAGGDAADAAVVHRNAPAAESAPPPPKKSRAEVSLPPPTPTAKGRKVSGGTSITAVPPAAPAGSSASNNATGTTQRVPTLSEFRSRLPPYVWPEGQRLSVCLSGMDTTDRERVANRIRLMGGTVLEDWSDRVTLLVVKDSPAVRTPKFLNALAKGVMIVTSRFFTDQQCGGHLSRLLEFVPELSHNGTVVSAADVVDAIVYHQQMRALGLCPQGSLSNMMFTVVDLPAKVRATVADVIVGSGGKVSKSKRDEAKAAAASVRHVSLGPEDVDKLYNAIVCGSACRFML